MQRPLIKGVLIFFGLITFHLCVSLSLSLITRSSFFTHMHNGDGIWNFAMDSSLYHTLALDLFDILKEGDFTGWSEGSGIWHVKWIALSYAIFVPHPLSFAPVNAITWATSVISVYYITRRLFPPQRLIAVLSALIFGCWPSYLAHSTQLLKEPFYVTGLAMMIWGWVSILSASRKIGFSILVGFGALLSYLNRPYLLGPLLLLSLLGLVFVIWRARCAWKYASLAFVFILGITFYDWNPTVFQWGKTGAVLEMESSDRNKTKSPSQNRIDPKDQAAMYSKDQAAMYSKDQGTMYPKERVEIKPRNSPPHPESVVKRHFSWMRIFLKGKFLTFTRIRDGWIGSYPLAGSNIDSNVSFRTSGDVIRYLPRALQIGFFAPFPAHWFESGKLLGKEGRMVAGMEMMGFYFLLIGFMYFLVFGAVPIHIRSWLVCYCVGLVVLIAMVVNNLGALYRIRYACFLPIIIGGLYGWAQCRLVRRLKNYFFA